MRKERHMVATPKTSGRMFEWRESTLRGHTESVERIAKYDSQGNQNVESDGLEESAMPTAKATTPSLQSQRDQP